jgi:hypothetical protein
MQESQFKDHCSHNSDKEALSLQRSAQIPECCGTGCAVCVLDYPDLIPNQHLQDSEMMAMLQAFEEAEAMVTDLDNED